MRKTRRQVVKIILLAIISLVPLKNAVAAGIPVFDGANLVQNVLEAVRALQSNINEARMIINQIKDLASLDTTIVDEYSEDLQSLFSEVGQVQGLMQNLSTLQARFEELYPDFTVETSPISNARFSNTLTEALAESRKVMYGASRTGAMVLENLQSSKTQISRLMTASHEAIGNLQAQQAGNELIATVGSNLINLNAQVATLNQAHLSYMQTHNVESQANVKRMQEVLRGAETEALAPLAPQRPF